MTGIIKNKFLKMKIILVVCTLTLMSSTSIFAAEHIQKDYTFNSSNFSSNDELIITFELSELIQTQISTEQGLFTILEIPNSGFVGQIGRPQLPMWTRLYAVPDTEISFEILESNILESRHVGAYSRRDAAGHLSRDFLLWVPASRVVHVMSR